MPQDPLAQALLEAGCLTTSESPITYASGEKGHIYCDARRVLAHVPARELVQRAMSRLLQALPPWDALVGMATGGLPHAAALAALWRCPLFYMRSSSKMHGLQRALEGAPLSADHHRLVLIEDLVNRGTTLKRAIEALKKESWSVVGAICIVSYNGPQAKSFESDTGVPLKFLTTMSNLTA